MSIRFQSNQAESIQWLAWQEFYCNKKGKRKENGKDWLD
jgi:hypothetical protein